MKSNILPELLHTIQFAAYKHKNQRRKDKKGTPYIHHPIEVCRVLWETGSISDPDILKAALLHDVLEDTRTHPDEIKDRFGNDVLSLILEVTYEKSKPRKVRKEEQIMSASEKSPGAKQIEIADKLCNIKDTLDNPPWFWNDKRKMAYIEWAVQVVDGLRGVNLALEKMFDQLVDDARKKFGK